MTVVYRQKHKGLGPCAFVVPSLRKNDMAEPELVDYYRAKVVSLQIEAYDLEDGDPESLRVRSLRKMAGFYIEELEKVNAL